MTEYILKRSQRSRTMRLTVRPGGSVVLSVPFYASESVIERFMFQQQEWIRRATEKMRHLKPLPIGRKEYVERKEEARALIVERVAYFSAIYGFTYGRIAIRNTKSLWGSCSRKGNLNFSYALIHLPPELVDYVVVHELCHLKEHNHGRSFWDLVARALPEYQILRRSLRTYVLKK